MLELSWPTIAIAAGTMYLAEIYGTIVGGGSFLVQPVLVALGIPIQFAVANNIAADLSTTVGSLQNFRHEKNVVRWRLGFWIIPGTIAGAFLGSFSLPYIPAFWLEKMLGGLALSATIYLIFSKKDGIKEHPLPRYWKWLSWPVGLLVGFYMGVSGAGAGIFASVLLVSLFGCTQLQGIATRKIFLFAASLAALIGYYLSGLIIFKLFLPMMAAGWLAGQTGARVAVWLGDRWLKRIFTVVIGGLAVWLLLK